MDIFRNTHHHFPNKSTSRHIFTFLNVDLIWHLGPIRQGQNARLLILFLLSVPQTFSTIENHDFYLTFLMWTAVFHEGALFHLELSEIHSWSIHGPLKRRRCQSKGISPNCVILNLYIYIYLFNIHIHRYRQILIQTQGVDFTSTVGITSTVSIISKVYVQGFHLRITSKLYIYGTV